VELQVGETNTVPGRRRQLVVQSLQLCQSECCVGSLGWFRLLSRELGWLWRLSMRRCFIVVSLVMHHLPPVRSRSQRLNTVEELLLVGWALGQCLSIILGHSWVAWTGFYRELIRCWCSLVGVLWLEWGGPAGLSKNHSIGFRE